MCNSDFSGKLPPVVTGKCRSPLCFKNAKRLPTKYEANTNSWMTNKIFEDYLAQLDRKLGTKNRKLLLLLITLLPIRRTPHFLAISKLYFSQLTVPASYSL
jgi:hypothetical protein